MFTVCVVDIQVKCLTVLCVGEPITDNMTPKDNTGCAAKPGARKEQPEWKHTALEGGKQKMKSGNRPESTPVLRQSRKAPGRASGRKRDLESPSNVADPLGNFASNAGLRGRALDSALHLLAGKSSRPLPLTSLAPPGGSGRARKTTPNPVPVPKSVQPHRPGTARKLPRHQSQPDCIPTSPPFPGDSKFLEQSRRLKPPINARGGARAAQSSSPGPEASPHPLFRPSSSPGRGRAPFEKFRHKPAPGVRPAPPAAGARKKERKYNEYFSRLRQGMKALVTKRHMVNLDGMGSAERVALVWDLLQKLEGIAPKFQSQAEQHAPPGDFLS